MKRSRVDHKEVLPVTTLLQRLHDELVRRHYATTTLESYLKILKRFQRHIGKRLDRVGPEDLRRYQVYVLEERRLAVGTVVTQLAALRFFYLRVLKRRNMKEDLPYPKRPRRLRIILSPEEVQRLIAGAQNLFHRTMLMTLYGGGRRRSELLHLKVGDSTASAWCCGSSAGKVGTTVEVPLSPTLLTAGRDYYRWMRPQTYLFPGTQNGWRADGVRALIDGEPVGQAPAPLIVPSIFLDPAREDGYPWGPNCSWMPAAGGAIGPAGSLVIQSSPWDS